MSSVCLLSLSSVFREKMVPCLLSNASLETNYYIYLTWFKAQYCNTFPSESQLPLYFWLLMSSDKEKSNFINSHYVNFVLHIPMLNNQKCTPRKALRRFLHPERSNNDVMNSKKNFSHWIGLEGSGLLVPFTDGSENVAYPLTLVPSSQKHMKRPHSLPMFKTVRVPSSGEPDYIAEHDGARGSRTSKKKLFPAKVCNGWLFTYNIRNGAGRKRLLTKRTTIANPKFM